jgi:hypothetical protein
VAEQAGMAEQAVRDFERVLSERQQAVWNMALVYLRLPTSCAAHAARYRQEACGQLFFV